MIKLTLCIMFLSYFLGSCINPGLNYPYAENNTATDSLFGEVIKDDYRWLEINVAKNEKRKEWLEAQSNLTGTFFSRLDNDFLKDRISSLGEMSNFIPVGIQGREFYYLKTNIYKNKTCLFTYNLDSHKIQLRADLGNSLRSLNRLKLCLSSDAKTLAVVNIINDYQNSLMVFDLENSGEIVAEIPDVTLSLPFLYGDQLIYIEDGFNTNNFGNRVYSYNLKSQSKTVLFENDFKHLSDPIDLSLNQDKGFLYLSAYHDNDKLVVEMFDLNKSFTSNPVLNLEREKALNYRLCGSDDNHLFYIIHDDMSQDRVLSYHMENKKFHVLSEDSEHILSGFNQIKDHVIVSYNNLKENKVLLINVNDSIKKPIKVLKHGIQSFVNNPKDTTLLYIEETLFQSQTLMKSHMSDPSTRNFLLESAYMPYDHSDFKSEHITITTSSGKEIDVVISYKKDLDLNGKNPTILFSYPNSTREAVNSFFFSRILYMEQGYIFVQRSCKDYSKDIKLENNQDGIMETIEYLIANKYTSNKYLCLSGYEYGGTAIMNIVNKNPSVCKAVLLSDGIFDMLHHTSLDKMGNNDQQLYTYKTKEELLSVLDMSPYHKLKSNVNYPAILALPGNDNQSINPSHSYKLIAKLQMRTKGDNPILLYDQKKIRRDDDLVIFDYKEKIYHTLSFVSEVLDVQLDKKNYSHNKGN